MMQDSRITVTKGKRKERKERREDKYIDFVLFAFFVLVDVATRTFFITIFSALFIPLSIIILNRRLPK
jgi:hypothetical protein